MRKIDIGSSLFKIENRNEVSCKCHYKQKIIKSLSFIFECQPYKKQHN